MEWLTFCSMDEMKDVADRQVKMNSLVVENVIEQDESLPQNNDRGSPGRPVKDDEGSDYLRSAVGRGVCKVPFS